MSCLEALLPDDLEKHVQLNCARLNSYGEFRHTQEETTQWTSVRLAKARANKAKASTARAKAKGEQGQQGQQGRDKIKDKDKNKDSIECWNCGKRGLYSKDCWRKKNTNKGGSKGKHKSKECNGCSQS